MCRLIAGVCNPPGTCSLVLQRMRPSTGYMPELRDSSQCGGSRTLAHHYRHTVDLGFFTGTMVL
jgi:hypothetical protein